MPRYIDADAFEKYITRDEWDTPDETWRPESEFGLIIDAIPTADVVEVVHGEWINIDKRGKNVQCSKCGNTLDLRGVNAGRGDANYCPNCGAEMRGGQNELHKRL